MSEVKTKAPRRRRKKHQASTEQQPETIGVQAKIKRLQRELSRRIINWDREIVGLMTAILAREHVVFLGPPGVAKSLTVTLLCKAISGARMFDTLLTSFSLPEELFGHYGLKAMKEDRFERVVKGKLPDSHFVFLDEVFKANSPILNACLKAINEREFNDGHKVIKCPLETLIGASNELPADSSLDALFDRFMLRYWVGYLTSRDDRKRLLQLRLNPPEAMPQIISLDELHKAQVEVEKVIVSDDTQELFLDVWDCVEKAGFIGSDRRYGNTLRVLQAHAYLQGRNAVCEDDLMMLSHMLWKEPKDYAPLARVIAQAANPTLASATELLEAAKEEYAKIPFSDSVSDDRSVQVMQVIMEANQIFIKAGDKLESLKTGKSQDLIQQIVEMQLEIIDMKATSSKFAAKIGGLSL